MEEHSYDAPKFIVFLKEVRAAVGEGKVYLFLDNCSVHHQRLEVAPAFKELDIEPVWNLPYCPEYNAAVERYWAQLKSRYRPLLLQRMLTTPRAKDKPMREALYQAIRETPDSSLPAFVEAGLRALYTDAKVVEKERDTTDEPARAEP